MPRQASLRRSPQSVSALAFLIGCCLGISLGYLPINGAQAQSLAVCAARDWNCLLVEAAADVRRDTDENGDAHGRYLVEIAQAYPRARRVGVAESFLSIAGNDDDLRARIQTFLIPSRLHQEPDVGTLRKALASSTSPEPDFAFPEYARMAFVGLIAGNARDTILKLWREEGRYLWRDAPQAELIIDSWLAETAPDLLGDSIKTRGLVDGGWASIAAVAQRLCRGGARDKGDNLLGLLDQARRDWSTNRSHEAADLASSVSAVAACDGFAAAEKRLDLALAQMKSDIVAINTHVADKEDAEASVELLRQTVAETGIRPLLRAYLDAGRTEDARRVFGRQSSSQAAADVIPGADGSTGNTDASSDEDDWQSEYVAWAKGRSYSDNPQLVLADVERWEKEGNDEVGIDAMAQMQRTADALLGFQGAKRPYVLRLKALGERIAALPDADGLPGQQTEVILATSELQLADCLPGEAQLTAWARAFADAPGLEARVHGRVVLARLLRLMEDEGLAAKRDPAYGACVISAKM